MKPKELLDLYSIKMLSDSFGLIVGEEATMLSYNLENLNWQYNPAVAPPYKLYSVFFSSIKHGYIVGSNGVYLRTQDDGWFWRNLSPQIHRRAIYSYLTIVWIGDKDGNILRSGDYGKEGTWETINVSDSQINSLYFSGPNYGWAVTESGEIYHTNDSGLNWHIQHCLYKNPLKCIDFWGSKDGIAVGVEGTILRTKNGKDWVKLKSYFDGVFFSVVFYDNNKAWIVGEKGSIFSVIEDHPTMISIEPGLSNINLYSVCRSYSKNAWAVGEKNTILFYNNSIKKWGKQKIVWNAI